MAKIVPVTTDRLPISTRDAQPDDVLLLTANNSAGQPRNTNVKMQYIGDNIATLVTEEELTKLTYFNKTNSPNYIVGNGRGEPLGLDDNLVARNLMKKALYPISQVGRLSDQSLPVAQPVLAFTYAGASGTNALAGRSVFVSAKQAVFGKPLDMECLVPVTDGFRSYYCVGSYKDDKYTQSNVEYRPTLPVGYSYDDMVVTNIFCHNDDLMLIRVSERNPNLSTTIESRRDFIALVETFGSLQARYHRVTKIDKVKFSSTSAGDPASLSEFYNANVWIRRQDGYAESAITAATDNRLGWGVYRTASGVRLMRRRRTAAARDHNSPISFCVYALKKDDVNGVYLETKGITKVANKTIGSSPVAGDYVDYPAHQFDVLNKSLALNESANATGAAMRLTATAADLATLSVRDGSSATTIDGESFQIVTINDVPRLIVTVKLWITLNSRYIIVTASVSFDILNTATGVGTTDLGIFSPANHPTTWIAKRLRSDSFYTEVVFANDRFTKNVAQKDPNKQDPALGRHLIGTDGSYVVTTGLGDTFRINLVNAPNHLSMVNDYTSGEWGDDIDMNVVAVNTNPLKPGHLIAPVTTPNIFANHPLLAWSAGKSFSLVNLQSGLRPNQTYADGNVQRRGYPRDFYRSKVEYNITDVLSSTNMGDIVSGYHAATGEIFPTMTATAVSVDVVHGAPYLFTGLATAIPATIDLTMRKIITSGAPNWTVTAPEIETTVNTAKIMGRIATAVGSLTIRIRHVLINSLYYIFAFGSYQSAEQIGTSNRREFQQLWSTASSDTSTPLDLIAEVEGITTYPQAEQQPVFILESGAKKLTIATTTSLRVYDLNSSDKRPVVNKVNRVPSGMIVERESGLTIPQIGHFNGIPSTVSKLGYGDGPSTTVGERIMMLHPSEPILFRVFTTDPVPFYLNGAEGEFMIAEMDASSFKPAAGATARIYLSMTVSDRDKVPTFALEDEKVGGVKSDTIGRVLLAILTLDSTGIIAVDAPPFIRIGVHRLMSVRAPGAIAVTDGAVAQETFTSWGYL